MPKFRKKPIVIEAEQFRSDAVTYIEGVYWMNGMPRINTLEGPLKVSDGDWIITGIKGQKYPCKPDIFDATYDLVNEE